ncbi:hemolysin activation/secretion protein [Sphingobium sp. B1D7B]|uniref:ShlB/FhaC/HecB family hemolysin secretion/activation protein n=1 Tax=Sphingobium sp. B1D7B TaxID=2940578 RepID=UPI0022251349|nr:ShlB/FhaC/HecB family hemolysin secretion/activation protein [Sphingobium sp. B1D7B]MCW2406957.1 hemolysin activation/secretion protein [Sphingobium sp. B1D7B]
MMKMTLNILLAGTALSCAVSASAQTAVERNLPPVPKAEAQRVEMQNVLPADADSAPIGPALRALVLLNQTEALRDAAGLTDGVVISDVPSVDKGHAASALKKFLGRPLSRQLIAQIQAEIARQSRAEGRPFVSLSAPEQEITSGVLQLRVTEFRIGSVDVKGLSPRAAEAVKRRVRAEVGGPVDSRDLSEDIDWLNRDPFAPVGAQFAPGAESGKTALTIVSRPPAPVRFYAGWSNTGARSTGLDRFFVGTIFKLPVLPGAYASYQLTGSDDAWWQGSDFLPKQPRYRAQGGRLYIPTLPRQNIEVMVSDALTNQVINKDFSVRQRTTETTVAYRSALSAFGLPSGSGDLVVGLEAKQQHRVVFFGRQVALDASADIWQALFGWSKSWQGSTGNLTVAANLHVSPGDPGSRASKRLAEFTNGRTRDNRYSYGTLDISGLQRLPLGLTYVGQLSMQYAKSALPLPAQLGLGGDGLVRGYTPDEGAFDRGVVFRNELRLPAFSLPEGTKGTLSPYIFVDAGRGHDNATHKSRALASTGFGGDYRLGDMLSIGVNSAWALRDGERTQAGEWRVQLRTTFTL